MPNIHPSALTFDRGINSITHARQDTLTSLPEREQAPPPDVGSRPQLDVLLALPTLDDVLDAAVRPVLENRDLLVPTHFQKELVDTLNRLLEAATQAHAEQKTPSADDNSDTTRTLNRAARLLKEESDLRDLLQMYRSTLYQG